MTRDREFKISLVVLISLFLTFLSVANTRAEPNNPPERTRIEIETFEAREWWLLTWSANEVVCKLLIDHDDLPNRTEIYRTCGNGILKIWLNQSDCDQQDPSKCEGYYLHYIETRKADREVIVDLPVASVAIRLIHCSPNVEEDLCTTIPSLQIIAEEPLKEERITYVNYRIKKKESAIEGNSYDLSLFETDEEGITLLIWADSSYGDSSEAHEVLVRVFPAVGQKGWHVDVVSALWQSKTYPENVFAWWALPPAENEPQWLSTPGKASKLATEKPYYYLAGRLISNGIAEASECNKGGIRTSGYANQCGLEMSVIEVNNWQNQFDKSILRSARKTGVPAFLLKNLIAQESQFWPGEYSLNPNEYGFGRMTEEGTDALLRWNEEIFENYCSKILSDDHCDQGYTGLESELQLLLRGAIASDQNVSCSSCPLGFDFEKLDSNIKFVADSVMANAIQVGQIIRNATNRAPGKDFSYKDLWRFTLVNYNVGPGCLSDAISEAVDKDVKLNWTNVSERLDGQCKNAILYVKNVRDGS